ncbi:hypothetical protein EBZ80_23545 [bacterium]|nr:hypothetical protein [bacterium]
MMMEIVAKNGPIGVARMRAALLQQGGLPAVRWFDAECGVQPPAFEHTVQTDGTVTSTEVA